MSTIPNFTIKELRDAVPAHLHERSLVKSSLYLVANIAVSTALWVAASYIEFAPSVTQPILWFTYWMVQGFFFTGIWVVGHECGHQSFSDSKTINNSLGLVLHTFLLVPFHSWRISHGMHHKATGHMEKDQVFVPPTRSQISDWQEAVADTPIAALVDGFQILIALTVGWPGYLTFNFTSQQHDRRTNHYEPSSPIFKPSHRNDIILSDVALTVFFFILYRWSEATSWSTVIAFWGIPYLWTNMWLVLITYLHHTHQELPHYRDGKWTFTRGALATVDRDYGFLNPIMHHIGDTHVAHHLFSTMPHYHAVEATAHLRKVLGDHYLFDDTPIFKALWREWRSCQFVDDEGDVVYYKKISDLKKSK